MATLTHITSYCDNCGDDCEFVREERNHTLTIRGKEIAALVPVMVCAGCGETQPDPEHDAMLPFYSAYRDQMGLLHPHDIRRIHEQYGLSRETFAKLLGMSPASLYRYEGGALQDQAHDELLRACEEPFYIISLVDRHRDHLSKLQYRRFCKAIESRPQVIRAPLWAEITPLTLHYTGYRKFSYLRFALMIRTLCDVVDGAFRVKLNKLCFYADFLACKECGAAISGSPYQRLPRGPVPHDYGAILDRFVEDEYLCAEPVDFDSNFSGTLHSPGPKVPIATDPLSKDELEILHFIGTQFRHMTRKEIEDLSHKEKAWLKTPPKKFVSYKWASQLTLDRPKPHD